MCFWYVLAGCLQEVVEAKNSIATFEATFKATEAKKKVEKKKKIYLLWDLNPGLPRQSPVERPLRYWVVHMN